MKTSRIYLLCASLLAIGTAQAAEMTGHEGHKMSNPASEAPIAAQTTHSAHEATHENAHAHAIANPSTAQEMPDATVADSLYSCPMHPQIVRQHEGTCPICGMKLVRMQMTAPQDDVEQQAMNRAQPAGLQQDFAIRTLKAQTQTLWKYMPTFGRVVADETKVVHVHPRASGWISDLSVRNDGDAIKQGQMLYRIYSPEIVAAQQDFLQVLNSQKQMGKQAQAILDSAKMRLQLLGLSDATIQQLTNNQKAILKVPVYAPHTGYVSHFKVQPGMYVQPQTELMQITNLATIWVEAEVMALHQAWLKKGLTVEIRTPAYPGKSWESTIDYVYPIADAVTQAFKVRIPLENDAQLFKPNMLVEATIYGGPKRDVLAIAQEAVISDGDVQRVVVVNPKGGFRVKDIKTGMQTRGVVEVLSGLQVGEEVVVSGQFMLDSESQIQANLRRLTGLPAGSSATQSAHAHH